MVGYILYSPRPTSTNFWIADYMAIILLKSANTTIYYTLNLLMVS